MEKVYKTKIAIWLICAIIGFTVIPIIPVLVYDFSWIVVTIVALIRVSPKTQLQAYPLKRIIS